MVEIKTLSGAPASVLGLAGAPQMERGCVGRAFEAGVNYFFFYNLSFATLLDDLNPLLAARRAEVVVSTGSEERRPGALRRALDEARGRLGIEALDIFFAEYISPADDMAALLGEEGVFAALHRWKAEGLIRHVGATVHSRELARALVASGRVEVLMHRYNMAHRKSAAEVLPAAEAAGVPVVAFTCTRWASLLGGAGWEGRAPTAAECYRYALRHPAVRVALTAPATRRQLEENLAVLAAPALEPRAQARWEAYGDWVYGEGTDAFETEWP